MDPMSFWLGFCIGAIVTFVSLLYVAWKFHAKTDRTVRDLVDTLKPSDPANN